MSCDRKREGTRSRVKHQEDLIYNLIWFITYIFVLLIFIQAINGLAQFGLCATSSTTLRLITTLKGAVDGRIQAIKDSITVYRTYRLMGFAIFLDSLITLKSLYNIRYKIRQQPEGGIQGKFSQRKSYFTQCMAWIMIRKYFHCENHCIFQSRVWFPCTRMMFFVTCIFVILKVHDI